MARKKRLTGTGSGGPGFRKAKELFAERKSGRIYMDRDKAKISAGKKKKSAIVKRAKLSKVK